MVDCTSRCNLVSFAIAAACRSVSDPNITREHLEALEGLRGTLGVGSRAQSVSTSRTCPALHVDICAGHHLVNAHGHSLQTK